MSNLTAESSSKKFERINLSGVRETVRNRDTGLQGSTQGAKQCAYLRMNRTMAQKQTSTATTEKMLDSSATDTSMVDIVVTLADGRDTLRREPRWLSSLVEAQGRPDERKSPYSSTQNLLISYDRQLSSK